MSRKKGSILLTFILLLGISAILLSYIYLIIGRTVNSGNESNRIKALYIAEAGLNKAVWNEMNSTPVGSWITSTTEAFGGGTYSISATNMPSNIVRLISTGEVNNITRTLELDMINNPASTSLFSQALYSRGNLSIGGSCQVNGPVFADGNINLSGSSSLNGEVEISAGHTISKGTATVVSPTPAAPTLDATSYDNLISTAAGQTAGNLSLSGSGNYDLGGGTLYVNGNMSVSGSKNIIGGGTIVITGTFNHSGSGDVDPNTTIISDGNTTISGSSNMATGCVLYSSHNIDLSGSGDITGAVLSQGSVSGSGSGRIIGVIYSTDVDLTTVMTGSRVVIGAIVTAGASSFSGSVDVTYDADKIPASIPGIVAGSSGMQIQAGTWKEL